MWVPFDCRMYILSSSGKYVLLQRGITYTLGRPNKKSVGVGNRIDFTVPNISRDHCEIQIFSDYIHVRDLKSRRGTSVQGRKITEVEEKFPVVIKIADVVMRIDINPCAIATTENRDFSNFGIAVSSKVCDTSQFLLVPARKRDVSLALARGICILPPGALNTLLSTAGQWREVPPLEWLQKQQKMYLSDAQKRCFHGQEFYIAPELESMSSSSDPTSTESRIDDVTEVIRAGGGKIVSNKTAIRVDSTLLKEVYTAFLNVRKVQVVENPIEEPESETKHEPASKVKPKIKTKHNLISELISGSNSTSEPTSEPKSDLSQNQNQSQSQSLSQNLSQSQIRKERRGRFLDALIPGSQSNPNEGTTASDQIIETTGLKDLEKLKVSDKKNPRTGEKRPKKTVASNPKAQKREHTHTINKSTGSKKNTIDINININDSNAEDDQDLSQASDSIDSNSMDPDPVDSNLAAVGEAVHTENVLEILPIPTPKSIPNLNSSSENTVKPNFKAFKRSNGATPTTVVEVDEAVGTGEGLEDTMLYGTNGAQHEITLFEDNNPAGDDEMVIESDGSESLEEAEAEKEKEKENDNSVEEEVDEFAFSF